jgi:uncharacterized coiled-coil protein SlyX
MDPEDLQRRLEKLEIDAAWQTRTLQDLDEVVRGLADAVRRMEDALARLEASSQLTLRDDD